ncbi:MAG: hypothetical protein ACRD36_02280 [Candidatus Acidiferrum sp.]
MMDMPIRIMAVVGAAFIGAFGTSGLLRLLARLTTRQNLPPTLLRITRLMGGVVVAWLASIWLFNGGAGWGTGGGGSEGKGSADNGSKFVSTAKELEPELVSIGEILQVEVLHSAILKGFAGKNKEVDPRRCYRIDYDKGSQLLTLQELKDLLNKRQAGEHPLRQVTLVLYHDSPDKDDPQVIDLKRWISEDLKNARQNGKVVVNIDMRGDKTPTK